MRPVDNMATMAREPGRLKLLIDRSSKYLDDLGGQLQHIETDLTRLIGCGAAEAPKGCPESPTPCEAEQLERNVNRLERLAVWARESADRIKTL